FVSAAELKQLPLFAGIPHKFLEWNAGSVVRRRLAAGEVLCREGDYGNTAFIIVSGRFQISVRTRLAHVENRRAAGLWGWLGRISTTFTGRGEDATIRVDGGKRLSYGTPVAERTAEDVI